MRQGASPPLVVEAFSNSRAESFTSTKQLASSSAAVAPVIRAAWHAGVRRRCRQFFRRNAIVDRAGENRDGNDIVDPDLPASLTFSRA